MLAYVHAHVDVFLAFVLFLLLGAVWFCGMNTAVSQEVFA